MPNQRRGRAPSRSSSSRGSGGAAKPVLAFILGAAVTAGGVYLYLHSSPVKPIDSPASPALSSAPPTPAPHVRPAPAHAQPVAPFGTSEDVFEAGARLYSARCAGCHGTPRAGAATQRPATQIWREARQSTAARSPGELYTAIAAGVPARGMPAYAGTLTETQLWQLALLLKHAGEDLPDPVVAILNSPHVPSNAARK